MIDLAVPRDIEPSVRDCPGIALYDMDDLQRGRRAEPRRSRRPRRTRRIVLVARGGGPLRGTGSRASTWCRRSRALRERGDEIVEQVLRENESRWESLTEADRERLETMASAVVSRLLHEPTRAAARRRRRGGVLSLRARPARAVRPRGRSSRRTRRRPPRSPASTPAASAAAGDPARHARKRAGAGPGQPGGRAAAGEVELVPITTSGDERRRGSPELGQVALRQGDRGGAARGRDRPGRALGQGRARRAARRAS